VEALLDSGVTRLVISSEFAKKQCFKLKKLERPMNVRNVDGLLNKERPIKILWRSIFIIRDIERGWRLMLLEDRNKQ